MQRRPGAPPSEAYVESLSGLDPRAVAEARLVENGSEESLLKPQAGSKHGFLRTLSGANSPSGGTASPPRVLRAGIVDSMSGWWGGPPPRLSDVGIKSCQDLEEDGSETSRVNAYRQFAKNAQHVFGTGNRDSDEEDTSPRKEPVAKRYEPPTPRDRVLAGLQAPCTHSPQARYVRPIPPSHEALRLNI